MKKIVNPYLRFASIVDVLCINSTARFKLILFPAERSYASNALINCSLSPSVLARYHNICLTFAKWNKNKKDMLIHRIYKETFRVKASTRKN